MQGIFILIFASLLFSCDVKQPEIIRNENTLMIKTKTGVVKLRVWSDAIIQVIHAPDMNYPTRERLLVLKNPKQNTDWNFGQKDKFVSLTTNKITLKYDISTGSISFDVIVQDWQYWGKSGWNAMDFDRDIFPDPKEMLKEIHAMNAHYSISV
jgi:hypothetical protein